MSTIAYKYYTLPANWHSFLMLHDSSKMKDKDRLDMFQFLANKEQEVCVNVNGSSYFEASTNDAGSMGCMVFDFTFMLILLESDVLGERAPFVE